MVKYVFLHQTVSEIPPPPQVGFLTYQIGSNLKKYCTFKDYTINTNYSQSSLEQPASSCSLLGSQATAMSQKYANLVNNTLEIPRILYQNIMKFVSDEGLLSHLFECVVLQA